MTYSGHFISGPPCISITDLASAFRSNNQPEGQPLSEASLVSWQKAEREDAELEDPILKWHVPHHCHSHFIGQNKSWSPSWFVLPSVGRLLITNLMSLLRMRWTIMQDSLGESQVQADSRCRHVGLGGLPAVLPEITSPAVCGIPHQCIAHLWSSLWKTQETWDSERLSHFTKVTQLMDWRIKSGFHFRFFFFDQNKILNNAKKFSMHWGSVICPRQQISRKALDSCFRNKIACAMVTFYIYCCILLPFYLIDSKPTIFHHCMLECHNCINRFHFVLSAPLVCRAI